MTKEEFKARWESSEDGGGITGKDIAECAKAWGISSTPRTSPMDQIIYQVVSAAGVVDAEEYKPSEDADDPVYTWQSLPLRPAADGEDSKQ